VFDCISSLSTIWFWDDSKVSRTKNRNKTAGAYSGIPGDDMGARILKADLKPRAGRNGGEPRVAASRGGSPRVPGSRAYM
jgi:hypothetical protein